MNLTSGLSEKQKKIWRQITKLKPKKVKVKVISSKRYTKSWNKNFPDQQKSTFGGGVVFYNKGKYNKIGLTKSLRSYNKLHIYLHEVCHTLAKNKTEFQAENLLRKICREKGWNKILEQSMVNIANWFLFSDKYPRKYKVAAKLILKREPDLLDPIFPPNEYQIKEREKFKKKNERTHKS